LPSKPPLSLAELCTTMRLLERKDGKICLTNFFSPPPYAILSHTWGNDDEEVSYADLTYGLGKRKAGYRKIQFCVDQAAKDGLRYSWVDTCCIDKTSSSELTEAINSMFSWYKGAKKCYVFLSDVAWSGHDNARSPPEWELKFRSSRWFTRGWTLQELLAPTLVEFFSRDNRKLGNKKSLERQINDVTGISVLALQGHPLSEFSVDDRMAWAVKRKTKRPEDEAYCLLGIFDVSMPLIYGERRDRAFRRLEDEIAKALRGMSWLLFSESSKI
jgi:Heterokaryon incompatibility protein (HET)